MLFSYLPIAYFCRNLLFMFGARFHRKIYILAFAITLAALPLSVVGVSIGLITLAINFLLSAGWRAKWKRIGQYPLVWVFVSIYLPILIGGLVSDGNPKAFELMRLWLPLLVVPLVIAMSDELSAKELQLLFIIFVASVFTATVVGGYFYIDGVDDLRKLSPVISHIRLSLMVNLSIAIILYLYRFYKPNPWVYWLPGILLTSWFIFFLFMLQSFTGIVMLALLVVVVLYQVIKQTRPISRFVIITAGATALFITLSSLLHLYDSTVSVKLTPDNNPRLLTANGNPYFSDTLSRLTENGYLVNINICEAELRKEWGIRSAIPFDSTDKKGQPIKLTLIRYLASTGLTKDSVGLSKLDSRDISLVERGFTNVLYRNRPSGFRSRLYEFFYDINQYRYFGKLTGGSVLRRILYFQAAWYVVQKNFWLGAGYENLHGAMDAYYDFRGIDLPKTLRFMPHNQYLTVWASAGIVGLIVFLAALIIPFVVSKNFSCFLVQFFLLMMLISMLFEDTLLTHIGVSLMAVFSAILLFGYRFYKDANP